VVEGSFKPPSNQISKMQFWAGGVTTKARKQT